MFRWLSCVRNFTQYTTMLIIEQFVFQHNLNKPLTLNLFTVLLMYTILAPVHSHFKLPQILLGGNNNNNGPIPNPLDIVKSWIPQPDCGIRCRVQEHFRPEYQQHGNPQQQYFQQNGPQRPNQHYTHRPHQYYGAPYENNGQDSPQQYNPQYSQQYFTPPLQQVQQNFNAPNKFNQHQNYPQLPQNQMMIHRPTFGQPQIQEPQFAQAPIDPQKNSYNPDQTALYQPRPGQPQIQENVSNSQFTHNQPQINQPTRYPQKNSNNPDQITSHQPRPAQPQIQEPIINSQFTPNKPQTTYTKPSTDVINNGDTVMDINQGFNPPMYQQNQQSNIYAPVPQFPNTNNASPTEPIFPPNKQDQPTHANMLQVSSTILPGKETNDFIYPDSDRYIQEVDNISRLIDVRRRRSILSSK